MPRKTDSIITYFGGKASLSVDICGMIPAHSQYVEPFFGSGAVFFTKPRSAHEVINDYDLKIITLWSVLQNDYERFFERISNLLFSEFIYKKTKQLLKNLDKSLNNKRESKEQIDILENKDFALEVAVAVFYQLNAGFGAGLYKGFAFDKNGSNCRTFFQKLNIKKYYSDKLRNVEIFCRDAIDLIKLKDSKETFFYIDPPYPETTGAHYQKYESVFYDVLELLPNLKGNFILSSYPNERLSEIVKESGFFQKSKNLFVSVNRRINKETGDKLVPVLSKIEVLTYNYKLPNNLFN